ncbi:hypothetical protein NtB2_01509 [Lactococcus termiticola]|uniref:Uncharacterized protein n=1 Tax=Lactococcus termiticola TaxID=2169526 RepID=A0A2R5HH51_9LACT|nr:hypothetical protein NtB2_01509 [Lactococcus termiticola]
MLILLYLIRYFNVYKKMTTELVANQYVYETALAEQNKKGFRLFHFYGTLIKAC